MMDDTQCTPAATRNSAPESVLQLGDPGLRRRCRHVEDVHCPQFLEETVRLACTLQEFRAAQGFGRAIAAPQIGIPKRFIALNLGRGPFLIVNPVITWRDPMSFTLWDDCMSFPDLLVRVRRHRSVSVSYTDEAGEPRSWVGLDRARAELLQHEIDHLDGILAIDRAHGRDALVTRVAFARHRDALEASVDYRAR